MEPWKKPTGLARVVCNMEAHVRLLQAVQD